MLIWVLQEADAGVRNEDLWGVGSNNCRRERGQRQDRAGKALRVQDMVL